MKILFLDQYSDLGGAQQCLLELLPAVCELAWLAVVAAPAGGAMLQRASDMGAKVEDLHLQRYSAGKKSLGDAFRFLREASVLSQSIARLVNRHQPDLLYINGPRLIPAAGLCAGAMPPVIFHSHSYIESRAVAMVAGRALKRLDARVIGCCEFVGARWRNYVPSNRLRTVYNGVADQGYHERPLSERARIGIVGRIAPEKGQLPFVEMARILLASFPHLQFRVIGDVLFGSDRARNYRRSVEEASKGLPVRFLGWQHDTRAIFEEIDLLVVPSTIAEATTRVIPEAWSAGIPVVATALGGIAEIVRGGENGFLVSHAKPYLLAAQISAVLSLHEAEVRRITLNARLCYERQFTIAQYRQQILSICRQF